MKRRILVTGAAGGVARLLLPGLVADYDVVETDARPVDGGVRGDLRDPGFVAEVTTGVDAIVHLAAVPDPASTFDALRGPNIEVVASVLAADVPRVVLASSAHVMGQYTSGGLRPDGEIDPDWPVAPCCPYGATKAFAEAYGRMVAYRAGRPVVVLRLGATTERPPAVEALGAWLGPDDLRRLVTRALEADVGFDVCHGVSANTRGRWGLRNRIGYSPTQDSERFLPDVPDLPGWGACRPNSPLESVIPAAGSGSGATD